MQSLETIWQQHFELMLACDETHARAARSANAAVERIKRIRRAAAGRA